MMGFTTTEGFGKEGSGSGGVVVNIGSLVVGGKLVTVTGETLWPGSSTTSASMVTRAAHLEPTHDPETGYNTPKKLVYDWKNSGYEASLELDVGGPDAPKGLLEKVDVLAEIPFVIRKFVNYVAGTKPYIYQWLNPATLNITGPEGKTAVKGTIYNEETFISK